MKMPELKVVRKNETISSIISDVLPEDILEEKLNELFDFRYNIILDRVEFRQKGADKFIKVDGYHERSIVRLLKKQRIECNKSALDDVIGSDFSPKFDPFKNYFHNLPKWNKRTDYIKQLSSTVSIESIDQNYWERSLKKWLVASVACALGTNYNDAILVLLGPQGIGKTRWIHKLLPIELKSYFYSGTLDSRNKDIAIHLSECFLYCLDELEDLTLSKMGMFKANASESAIRLRRPYGRVAENLIRRASLVATVNVPRFLKDATGSRRFLTVYAKAFNYNHNIDVDKVFAQAFHLYQEGFQYWFNRKDIEEIELHNERFIDRSDLQEYILTYFKKADHSNSTHYLAASDIAKYIAVHSQKDIKTINIITLGKELNKLGFLTTKKSGIKLYMLQEVKVR
jgi:predicted P-loop ATPase